MNLRVLIGLIFMLMLGETSAQTLEVSDLPERFCTSDSGSGFVFRKGRKIETQCVLGFSERANFVISLNGKLVDLSLLDRRRTPGNRSRKYPSLGERVHEIYRSEDQTIEAVIDSQVARSTCEANDEKCCGNDYEGTLVVEYNKQRINIPIVYADGN